MSKYIFRILNYFAWTIFAFLLASVYMRIILGARPEPTTGLMKAFDFLYQQIFVHVGAIMGSIIASLFILLDVFYLHTKLKSSSHPTLIRGLILIVIFIIGGTAHYVLEKVVDVI